jgi:hypothetical protein
MKSLGSRILAIELVDCGSWFSFRLVAFEHDEAPLRLLDSKFTIRLEN